MTRARFNKKRIDLVGGELFLIPLVNNTFGLGQFVKDNKRALDSSICIFFSQVFKSRPSEYELNELQLEPISIQFITREALIKGSFNVVGKITLNMHNIEMPDIKFEKLNTYKGVKVLGAGIITDFMNAYHWLLPWDMMLDKLYFEKLMLTEAPRPK